MCLDPIFMSIQGLGILTINIWDLQVHKKKLNYVSLRLGGRRPTWGS